MKKFSLKNSRPYVALALLIQSFTFFIMFIILCVKKKSIAAAFLAVAAMEGAARALTGTRDYRPFCASKRTKKSTVRPNGGFFSFSEFRRHLPYFRSSSISSFSASTITLSTAVSSSWSDMVI